jgi:hypothetical protein
VCNKRISASNQDAELRGRDSSFGIATVYGLGGRGSIPSRSNGIFSPCLFSFLDISGIVKKCRITDVLEFCTWKIIYLLILFLISTVV